MWLWSLDIDVADISLVSAWGYVYTYIYIDRKRVTIDDLGRYLFIRKGGLNENGLWEM